MATFPKNNLSIEYVALKFGYGYFTSKTTIAQRVRLSTLCGERNASKINKWSRYKPVRYNFTTSRPENWWKAQNGMCGLSIPVYTSIGNINTAGTFLYQLTNQLDSWDYEAPQGGDTSPYRLEDFCGYNPDAICPIGMSSQTEYYINQSGDLQIDFELAVPAGSTYNLTLSDIEIDGTSLSEYYMGAMLVKEKTYLIGTSTSKIGTGSLSMIISGLTSSHVGTWKVYAFISSSQFDADGDVVAGKYACFPTKSLTIQIRDAGTIVQIYCQGYWKNSDKTIIEFYYHVANTGSNTLTIKNVRARFMRTIGDQLPSEGTVIGSHEYGDVMVEAKGSRTLGPYQQTISYISNAQYWIAGLADISGIDTTYTQIEESIPT